ncbi:MAG: Uma2 family endonuclease [Acidobacteria bacterium]|nr:Uma2 family endonuclease [Acidobacteriota bacterium]
MSTLTVTHVTPEEYLAAERLAETRSEYLDGGVYPMTGGSINHIRIVSSLTAELNVQLRGRQCDVLPTEMKVRLQESQKFFYRLTEAAGLESSLTLSSIECTLNLGAVYDKVDFNS